MGKFENITSDLSNINYGESNGSLFITTPELLSSLSLVSDDNYSLVNNSSCLNADKIYGSKVLKMNESIFSNLFRNAEKVRIKNHVQEKMLQEKINGHKGIEKKLHENLTKIEKTRQSLEEELFYMEKEMRALGLSNNKNDNKNDAAKQRNSTPASNTNVPDIIKSNPSENITINESRKNSTPNDLSLQRQKSFLTSKTPDYSDIEVQNNSTNMDHRSSITNLDFLNSEFAKRRHTWIKMSTQNHNESLRMDKKYTRKGSSLVHFAQEPLHYKPIIRKYSLGSHPLSYCNSLAKSRSSSVYLNDLTSKNSLTGASSSSDVSVFGDNQSASPIPPEILINKSNEQVYSPRILQLPKIDEIYAERKKRSRKVSFTQIDVNELDIPKTYMHSNEALEKYKFNPNYYLPDGTLKTKFLLPQLKDSLETVRKSRYIRQYSIDGSQNDAMDANDVVKYVFHDSEVPSIE